jgi:hypothetical protein
MPPFCCGRRDSLAERIDLSERRGELNDARVGLERQTSGTLGERTAGLGKVRESRRYRDRATGY